jgi:hypothetical protein
MQQSRRHFLRIGATGMFGLTLADLLRAEAKSGRMPKATSVIQVWLGGGASTIDMWDLKPDAPQNIRGEFRPIPAKADGVQICEHLPKTAGVMDRCALVRSLSHEITAHGPGSVYMATGHVPSAATEYPALGALAARLLPPIATMPPYVLFNAAKAAGFTAGPGYLGSSFGPFEVEGSSVKIDGLGLPAGFTPEQLTNRKKLRDQFDARFKALDGADVPAGLDRFQQQAVDILRSNKTRDAFDTTKEPANAREGYGPSPFGQSMLTARRLIEAGTRFVTVGLGGWDTHAGNFQMLRAQLLPQLDQALAALILDLESRGMLDQTIVYCAGEFGRTPRINGQAGRDHWARAMSVLLAGGGIKRGFVLGGTDANGMAPTGEPCTPADVAATVFQQLGVEPTQELRTAGGRPMIAFREGKVLEALVG